MVYMDASTGFQRYWPKFPQGWYCCLRPSYGAFEIALGYRWCSFGLTPPLNDTWGPSHTWEWLDLTQTTGAKRCTIQIICVWLFVYDYLLTFIRLQLYICGVRSYWILRYRPNTWQKTLQGFGSGVPSALIFYNERIYIYIWSSWCEYVVETPQEVGISNETTFLAQATWCFDLSFWETGYWQKVSTMGTSSLAESIEKPRNLSSPRVSRQR